MAETADMSILQEVLNRYINLAEANDEDRSREEANNLSDEFTREVNIHLPLVDHFFALKVIDFSFIFDSLLR